MIRRWKIEPPIGGGPALEWMSLEDLGEDVRLNLGGSGVEAFVVMSIEEAERFAVAVCLTVDRARLARTPTGDA